VPFSTSELGFREIAVPSCTPASPPVATDPVEGPIEEQVGPSTSIRLRRPGDRPTPCSGSLGSGPQVLQASSPAVRAEAGVPSL